MRRKIKMAELSPGTVDERSLKTTPTESTQCEYIKQRRLSASLIGRWLTAVRIGRGLLVTERVYVVSLSGKMHEW